MKICSYVVEESGKDARKGEYDIQCPLHGRGRRAHVIHVFFLFRARGVRLPFPAGLSTATSSKRTCPAGCLTLGFPPPALAVGTVGVGEAASLNFYYWFQIFLGCIGFLKQFRRDDARSFRIRFGCMVEVRTPRFSQMFPASVEGEMQLA